MGLSPKLSFVEADMAPWGREEGSSQENIGLLIYYIP